MLLGILAFDEMLFFFMPEQGTIGTVFILRWMQDVYHADKVLYVFCVPIESI